MARPKKLVDMSPEALDAHDLVIESAPIATVKAEVSKSTLKSKIAHMAIGVDLLGSATTLGGKNNLYVTPIGLVAHSMKTKRNILVPYSNIKGAELESGDPELLVKRIKEMFLIND